MNNQQHMRASFSKMAFTRMTLSPEPDFALSMVGAKRLRIEDVTPKSESMKAPKVPRPLSLACGSHRHVCLFSF